MYIYNMVSYKINSILFLTIGLQLLSQSVEIEDTGGTGKRTIRSQVCTIVTGRLLEVDLLKSVTAARTFSDATIVCYELCNSNSIQNATHVKCQDESWLDRVPIAIPIRILTCSKNGSNYFDDDPDVRTVSTQNQTVSCFHNLTYNETIIVRPINITFANITDACSCLCSKEAPSNCLCFKYKCQNALVTILDFNQNSSYTNAQFSLEIHPLVATTTPKADLANTNDNMSILKIFPRNHRHSCRTRSIQKSRSKRYLSTPGPASRIMSPEIEADADGDGLKNKTSQEYALITNTTSKSETTGLNLSDTGSSLTSNSSSSRSRSPVNVNKKSGGHEFAKYRSWLFFTLSLSIFALIGIIVFIRRCVNCPPPSSMIQRSRTHSLFPNATAGKELHEVKYSMVPDEESTFINHQTQKSAQQNQNELNEPGQCQQFI